MTDRPLTTGEGNTALWDEPPDAQITPEQAHEVAANWKDTTQLSNALDAMANECRRLREQLDAARQALGEIEAKPHRAEEVTARWRAALGVEGPAE